MPNAANHYATPPTVGWGNNGRCERDEREKGRGSASTPREAGPLQLFRRGCRCEYADMANDGKYIMIIFSNREKWQHNKKEQKNKDK